MARQQRPVDPAAGPLACFAYDLRMLREKVGNPTYRVLAKKAGYSATTLSEAAGAVRRPSLDVTLAYVGACDGDVEAWRHRWHELPGSPTPPPQGGPPQDGPDPAMPAPEVPASPDLVVPTPGDRAVSASPDRAVPVGSDRAVPTPADRADPVVPARPDLTVPTRAEPGGGVAAVGSVVALSPEPGGPADLVGSASEVRPAGPVGAGSPGGAGSRRSWLLRAAVAAVAVALLMGAAVGVTAAVRDRAPAAAIAGCPAPGGPVAFTGQTYMFTRVRSGAALGAPVLRTIPAGCDVGFTGFCLGDTVFDMTGGTDDTRWFTLSGGGVVASAVVHGNPPAALTPSACPDDIPAPDEIALAADPQPPAGGVRLRATGRHLRIVGYAARYTDASGDLGWHQLGFVGSRSPAFEATWQPGRLPNPPRRGAPVTIAAVACLGGDGPTGVVAAGAFRWDGSGPVTDTPLAPATRAAAARTACHYPVAP